MFFLEAVHEKYEKLSLVQKRIADYIIKNPEKVCFCSLKELANAAEVTEVTVLRFVKNVGFRSFVEMKQNMRDHMRTRFLGWGSVNPALDHAGPDMDKESMLDQFAANEIRVLENTYANTSMDQIEKAVAILKNANMVYVVGHELVSGVSSYLTRRLLTIGIKAVDLGNVSRAIYIDHMSYLGPGDMVVIFSTPGHFQFIVNTVHFLKEKGVPHIVLTDKAESPVAETADVVFTFDNKDLFFYNSILALFSLSNLLVYFLAMDDPKEINKLRSSLAKTTEEIGGISTMYKI